MQYVPGGHILHSLAMVWFMNVPSGQSISTAEPAGQKWPLLQIPSAGFSSDDPETQKYPAEQLLVGFVRPFVAQ
jgi:hypothetical protein